MRLKARKLKVNCGDKSQRQEIQLMFAQNYQSLELNMYGKWSIKIAQFQSQTKESYEKKNRVQQMMLIDSFDLAIWNRSTIIEIKEKYEPQIKQMIKMALIGYRMYCTNGNKEDQTG
ncbi:UNKNOWN [Stylonychia lemnae]|uniref:Uncharacterized protein n=1 Tax=Stylonychia lemnae TaxID=5949 RepID=A0A078ASE1_STYLE|nr:UNKNOWN [Stylonychia lemnae]|eukprot:CDW84881.1 UNKNOWN [Stylonychia lemnae]